MYLTIDDRTLIRHIQKKFNTFYPYLQIKFYYTPHKIFEDSADNDQIYAGKSIGEVKQTHISAVIEITPLTKVAEVEKEFQERFGLPVQIFMKNKNKWQQTTTMDNFTLKELNEFGRNSSDDAIIAEPDPDYLKEDE